MREQVVVLPPSTDRRKTSLNLGKRQDILLNTSRESRKWAVPESENAEKTRGSLLSSKDSRHTVDIEFVVAEEMKSVAEGRPIEASKQEALGERRDKALPACAPLLQWGQRKRSRCSRTDNHNSKPCNSTDDSAVLFRKTVRVQADKAQPYTSPIASKGNLKAKNGVVTKREHMYAHHVMTQMHAHQEEKCKQAKHVKNGLPDARQERKGSPLAGSKRGCPPPTHKHEQPKKACTLPEPKSHLPNTCRPPSSGGGESSPSKMELVWPKFIITLSRKEKEEDFLVMKGTKLPQRPRRRPKAVERFLHYCSPGSWLVDMSQTRYDVREKKRIKKKPRGLKAMESFDSDSE